jgi:hypothetical protein
VDGAGPGEAARDETGTLAHFDVCIGMYYVLNGERSSHAGFDQSISFWSFRSPRVACYIPRLESQALSSRRPEAVFPVFLLLQVKTVYLVHARHSLPGLFSRSRSWGSPKTHQNTAGEKFAPAPACGQFCFVFRV